MLKEGTRGDQAVKVHTGLTAALDRASGNCVRAGVGEVDLQGNAKPVINEHLSSSDHGLL
jgi:hypothetical protein